MRSLLSTFDFVDEAVYINKRHEATNFIWLSPHDREEIVCTLIGSRRNDRDTRSQKYDPYSEAKLYSGPRRCRARCAEAEFGC